MVLQQLLDPSILFAEICRHRNKERMSLIHFQISLVVWSSVSVLKLLFAGCSRCHWRQVRQDDLDWFNPNYEDQRFHKISGYRRRSKPEVRADFEMKWRPDCASGHRDHSRQPYLFAPIQM